MEGSFKWHFAFFYFFWDERIHLNCFEWVTFLSQLYYFDKRNCYLVSWTKMAWTKYSCCLEGFLDLLSEPKVRCIMSVNRCYFTYSEGLRFALNNIKCCVGEVINVSQLWSLTVRIERKTLNTADWGCGINHLAFCFHCVMVDKNCYLK